MTFMRLTAGRLAFAVSLLTQVAALSAETFPFDQNLMLDTARMGRVKRVPMLNVEANGNATIQLWCKDVRARVEVTDGAIRIEAEPLPDALPSMMSDGQCSPERMQADIDIFTALVAATAWQRNGDRLVLSGPATLRFFASSH